MFHRRRAAHQLANSHGADDAHAGDQSRLKLTAGLSVFTLLCLAALSIHSSFPPAQSIHSHPLLFGDSFAKVTTHQPGATAAVSPQQHLNASSPLKPPARLPHPLWWAAPVWSQSGYGSEAVSFIAGLVQAKLMHPADVWVTHSGDGFNAGDADRIMEADVRDLIRSLEYPQQQKALAAADLSRQAIVVCHSFPDCWVRPREYQYPSLPGCPCPTDSMKGHTAYRIGRTMFETNRLHEHLVLHAKAMDEVWVPSQFNVDTFAASGIPREKLFIVPQGVNLTTFDRTRHTELDLTAMGRQLCTGSEEAGAGKRRFTFLSVFKWEGRKGWEILLRSFLQEFGADEGVDLLIVTHPFMESVPSWPEKIRRGIRDRANIKDVAFESMPRIYVKSDYVPDADYPRLYKACDALVVPTRGEGWGRPQMEAMAMEMPVISTNWSGSTAFMNEGNSYLLHYDGLVPAISDGPSFFWFFTGSSWAAPSPTHLRQLMRRVVSDPAEARGKGVAARQHLLAEFSPQAIAHKLFEQVARVQKLLEERAASKEREEKARSREEQLKAAGVVVTSDKAGAQ